ncbi:RING-HC finger protein [Flavobacteriaceae bacterium]|nr:RING-HC finger protein [Flavobacteriaceae bacterium]
MNGRVFFARNDNDWNPYVDTERYFDIGSGNIDWTNYMHVDDYTDNTPKVIVVPMDKERDNDVKIPSCEPQCIACTENKRLECVVCMENNAICVISPCMHIILCISCSIKMCKGKAKRSVRCLICDEPIKSIKRVYF